jgi:dGTP triphosphohydrolase
LTSNVSNVVLVDVNLNATERDFDYLGFKKSDKSKSIKITLADISNTVQISLLVANDEYKNLLLGPTQQKETSKVIVKDIPANKVIENIKEKEKKIEEKTEDWVTKAKENLIKKGQAAINPALDMEIKRLQRNARRRELNKAKKKEIL